MLQVLVLGAFLFLELVLTAHSPIVGWTGIGFTSFLALIAFVLWFLQAIRRRPLSNDEPHAEGSGSRSHLEQRNAESSRVHERHT